MRKLVLELEPNDKIKKVQESIFENLESFEVLEMLRKDYEEGLKIGLLVLTTKENISIDDIRKVDH